jgi:hypothetical protein
MIRGKYIDFDIDSLIVENIVVSCTCITFTREGKAKIWGCFLAQIWDVFVDTARPKNVNKTNKKSTFYECLLRLI